MIAYSLPPVSKRRMEGPPSAYCLRFLFITDPCYGKKQAGDKKFAAFRFLLEKAMVYFE